MRELVTCYFTFGPDHSLPDGSPAGARFVQVAAPAGVDHRALFMAWLGSNRFSFEYTAKEWSDLDMQRHYGDDSSAAIITVVLA